MSSSWRVIQSSLVLLALLAGAAFPAVVLPRPPSSPNYIPRESYAESKAYAGRNDKAIYPNTNVEKPDTQDYRLVEIEVQNAENVDSLDLHGLVQAVLDNQQRLPSYLQHQQLHPSLLNPRRLDLEDDLVEEDTDQQQQQQLHQPQLQRNLTYPHPEVVPHSILGVRDVGRPVYEVSGGLDATGRHRYLLNPSQATKNLADEKLYYLKSSRPKVYVNFRGKSGNFRESGDSKITVRFEPGAYLRATPAYNTERKTKTPKKYDARIHGASTTDRASSGAGMPTTENTMVTSSELPKQIPAPPSRTSAASSSRPRMAHTTPVQRLEAAALAAPRRTDSERVFSDAS